MCKFLQKSGQSQAVKRSLVHFEVKRTYLIQGGHKPGKPGILRNFSEHGKLGEFSGNSVQPQGKTVANKVRHSNTCVKQLLTGYKHHIAGVDVELPLMTVIITFTFCCDNLWKNKFIALEKPAGTTQGIFCPL